MKIGIKRPVPALCGLLWFTCPLAGQEPDWKLVGDAAWQARDSQAECVFADRLWIMGGWFQSYEAPPRDVWSSRDGLNWSQVTSAAPWIHSDL